MPLITLFTAHPASVNESYGQHLRFAAAFSGLLMLAALAALVHALLPFLFQKTASRIIKKIHCRVHAR
ncbi:MAG: DUF6356 family protein [Sedimentitalea sp.]